VHAPPTRGQLPFLPPLSSPPHGVRLYSRARNSVMRSRRGADAENIHHARGSRISSVDLRFIITFSPAPGTEMPPWISGCVRLPPSRTLECDLMEKARGRVARRHARGALPSRSIVNERERARTRTRTQRALQQDVRYCAGARCMNTLQLSERMGRTCGRLLSTGRRVPTTRDLKFLSGAPRPTRAAARLIKLFISGCN